MAKPKKTGRKPSVKVNDMKAKEDPKGGLKYESRRATTTGGTAILNKPTKVQF